MKSEICAEKSKIIHQKASFLDKDCIFEAAQLSKPTTNGIVPCAPTPEKNNDVAVAINSDSPLTWVADSDNDATTDLDSSPRTPKAAIFDSFVQGPDELMLAPLVKKQGNESKFAVARRLNFDSWVGVKEKLNVVVDDEDLQEAVLLDTMYKSILNAIVSKQAEEVSADNLSEMEEEEDCSGYKTPTNAPRLTGIAETCPGAPRKSIAYSKKIELGFCRKLDF